MPGSPHDCASGLLDSVPAIMQFIGAEMRCRRNDDLTVPQFRSLAYLARFPGVALSNLAEHIGLSLPAMSKMIEGLVSKGLVSRAGCASDRRRVALSLTAKGKNMLRQVRRGAHEVLARKISSLSLEDRLTLLAAMRSLHLLFSQDREPGERA